ncbi:transposase, partial [Cohnella silvisoli]
MFPDHLTFEAFCQQFNSEQTCAEALFEARWPDGFRCPTCR